MADIVNSETRSRMMAGIRGRDTTPELLIRKALHRKGFRFRVHVRTLPGCPDLVFPKYHAVIFVHGCFWHRHSGCSLATMPSSNVNFWSEKFAKTVERDESILDRLRAQKWRIGVIWECDLGKKKLEVTSEKIEAWLHSDFLYFESSDK